MYTRKNLLFLLLLSTACASGEQISGSGTTASTTDSTTMVETTTTSTSTTAPTTDPTTDTTTTTTTTTEGPTTESESDTTEPTTDGPTTGPVCEDADGDGYGLDCDLGPDCDDDDPNNYTPEGCEGCIDNDQDNAWVGCDRYDEDKPGPDCDDSNVAVGTNDATELCNGIAENCAGEIDPLPPEEMCPAGGDEAPNVAMENGWACNVTQIGVDGCEIANCEIGYYDANRVPADGCECTGTSRASSLASCVIDPKGYLGAVTEGSELAGIPGTIPHLDAEDWYYVDFPANGGRPNAGSIQVSFSQNSGNPDNPDYRFEVYRTCASDAFGDGLVMVHTPGLEPPALEWWFEDNHQGGANYTSNIAWPEQVLIRVFRVNNPDQCTAYELSIKRVAN